MDIGAVRIGAVKIVSFNEREKWEIILCVAGEGARKNTQSNPSENWGKMCDRGKSKLVGNNACLRKGRQEIWQGRDGSSGRKLALEGLVQ